MSWWTQAVGKKEKVAGKVVEEPYMPDAVKDGIVGALRAFPDGCDVALETSGHIDSHSAKLELKIQKVQVL